MNVSRRWYGIILVALAACASEKPVEQRHAGKPTAPVKVEVDSVDLGNKRYEVRVTATPTENVGSLELRVVLPEGGRLEESADSLAFGATGKGETRTLIRHVILDVPGADVVGGVKLTNAGGYLRTRGVSKRLGAARPAEAPKKVNIVTLPDGTQVEEVRQ